MNFERNVRITEFNYVACLTIYKPSSRFKSVDFFGGKQLQFKNLSHGRQVLDFQIKQLHNKLCRVFFNLKNLEMSRVKLCMYLRTF